VSDKENHENLTDHLVAELNEHLQSVENPAERKRVAGLLRQLAHLPLEHTRASVETSAALAAVSLRASIEFLRAAAPAAQILEPAELRAWGEIGRRVTMNDVEDGVSFFVRGVSEFAEVPVSARPFVFQVCSRLMTLSATAAAETFQRASQMAREIGDAEMLRSIYQIASEVARRSAKHSTEFLNATPDVIAKLAGGSQPPNDDLTRSAIDLTSQFAERAGGIAADAWAVIPKAIAGMDSQRALRLMRRASSFLERGGGTALNVLEAGGEIMRVLPECFDDWIDLLWAVAAHGNAGLVAFTRASPAFFQTLSGQSQIDRSTLARRIMVLTREVARVDAESALACLRSAARALRTVSVDQFENWARAGLISGDSRVRRSYYALETRSSN
jgi:hypothetical protein